MPQGKILLCNVYAPLVLLKNIAQANDDRLSSLSSCSEKFNLGMEILKNIKRFLKYICALQNNVISSSDVWLDHVCTMHGILFCRLVSDIS